MSRTARNFFNLLFVIAVYFVAGKLGLLLASVNPSASPVWAPTGIAIAAFLLYGNRVFPAIFIGAFLVNITTAGSFATSLGIGIGNALEGFLAANLVTIFGGAKNSFTRTRDVLIFCVLAGLFAPMVSATIGLISLTLAGFAPWDTFAPAWITWWLGDVGGALIVAPFLLEWAKLSQIKFRIKPGIEITCLFAAVFIAATIVFRGFFPYAYITIPIVMWIVFRFGQRGGTSAVVLLSAIATYYTVQGLGPFTGAAIPLNTSLLMLQIFMSVTSIMTIGVGATLIEKHNAQVELVQKERRFRELIRKSTDAIALINERGVIQYAGPSTERLLGYSPEEFVGMNALELIHPDDLKHVESLLAKILESPGRTVNTEYRIKRKDGAWVWMEGTGTNLLQDPAIRAIVTNYRDITERKMIQDNQEHEKAEDEALLASIGDALLATDREGNIVLVNRAFEDMMGWKKIEVVNKQTADFVKMENEKGEYIPAPERPLKKAITTGRKIAATYFLTRKDKTKFPAIVVATPVKLKGEIIGGINVFHDITREKEIDREKTEFVSLASHQLRTPLSIIKWYIELLHGKDYRGLNIKQKNYLTEVDKASKRMTDLVDALLTTSRLESGTTPFQPQRVNVEKTVMIALDELKPQIAQRKLHIRKKFPTRKNLSVFTDAKLLHIILQNLFSNAVKYTRVNGRIVIDISVPGTRQLVIKVQDDGYGIPKKEQGKIFSKMYRASNIKSIEQEGTGLGLYMIKSILEKMGGDIHFSSVENKGSEFIVTLPLS